MAKRKEALAGRPPSAGRDRSRQSKRTNTIDKDFTSSAKSGHGQVKRNNRIVLTGGNFETVFPRRVDELTEENEKLKTRNRTLMAEREQFQKQNRALTIKAERLESKLRSILESPTRSAPAVHRAPRSEVSKTSSTESKDCRENNLEMSLVVTATSPKPALIEPTLPVVVTEEKKDDEEEEMDGDLLARLKREVAALKKEKLDGQICQIHERLDMEREHKRSNVVLNKAIANLNKYVESLKLEISKLKSHKGLNTEAPVFQFNPSLLKNFTATPLQQTIFQHSSQQAALLHQNHSSFLSAPTQQFPIQAQQSIYRPHQAAALLQEQTSIPPQVTSIKEIYGDNYENKLNIASQESLPPQRLSESADAGDWSNEAPGWGFEQDEEEIVSVQIQDNHSNRNVKVKPQKSRGGGAGSGSSKENNLASSRHSGRKHRGKNVGDDKNKYLNMESTVNHSSKKSQSKRRQKSKSQQEQSGKSSSKSSQRTQISLNYRISKSKKGSSSKQATMKGLMMGPHDPSLTVRLEPPSHHLGKKKGKRNYYRKNKGR